MSDLDPSLLEILACPCERHAPLEVVSGDDALRCTFCHTTFPVRGGIPILLLDEATPGSNGVGAASTE